jgi:antitoxin MazE
MEQIAVKTWENSQEIGELFGHKSFEERLADYDGEITVSDFEWGEPVGKEII